MKKISLFIIGLLIFPSFINAETITYNICESGCEYTSLESVETAINNTSDLSDKDIIININSDYSNGYIYYSDTNNVIKSVVINGNNHSIKDMEIGAKSIEINNLNFNKGIALYNSQRIKLINSKINRLRIGCLQGSSPCKETLNIKDVLETDNISFNNIKTLMTMGNIKIENMNFVNKAIVNGGGLLTINNSQLGKVLNYPAMLFPKTDIYNSTFESLRYVNVTNEVDGYNEYRDFFQSDGFNPSSLVSYDVYEFNSPTYGKITVYFDKEFEINPGEEIDLNNALDYYTSGKAIDYKINNEDIAKIENMKLKGLTGGKTRLTITTDDGHIVYRIWLKVKKEKVANKISKMVVKIPITGKKIKVWVVVVSILLLGVIGVCSYMLIKRKK